MDKKLLWSKFVESCDVFTDDEAPICFECDEPVYEEDAEFNEQGVFCPSCLLLIDKTGHATTYEERCEFVGKLWETKFNGNLSDADSKEFQQMVKDFKLDVFDVYEHMEDELYI